MSRGGSYEKKKGEKEKGNLHGGVQMKKREEETIKMALRKKQSEDERELQRDKVAKARTTERH